MSLTISRTPVAATKHRHGHHSRLELCDVVGSARRPTSSSAEVSWWVMPTGMAGPGRPRSWIRVRDVQMSRAHHDEKSEQLGKRRGIRPAEPQSLSSVGFGSGVPQGRRGRVLTTWWETSREGGVSLSLRFGQARQTVLLLRPVATPLTDIREAVRQCLVDPSQRRDCEHRMSHAMSKLAFRNADPQWTDWTECNRLLRLLRDYDDNGVRPPDCCLSQGECEHAVAALKGGWGNVSTARGVAVREEARRLSNSTGSGSWSGVSGWCGSVVLVLLVVLAAMFVGGCIAALW